VSGPVERISGGQYFLIGLVSVLAGGVYLWPSYVVAVAGVNAVYAIGATTAAAILITVMQIGWVERDVEGPVGSGLRQVLGTIGAWLILPVNGVLCLGMTTVLLALYTDMLQTFFYPFTPRLVMAGAMALTATSIAIRPLATVARSVQFWFPFLFASFIAVLAMAFGNASHWVAFHPTLPINPEATGRAAISTWFLFANSGLMASIAPFVRWKRRSKARLVAGTVLVVEGGVLVLLLGIVLATLGPLAVRQLTWPIIYVLSLVSVETFFLKGVGVFSLLLWTAALVLYLTLHFYCVSWNIEALAGGPRRLYVGGLALAAMLGAILLTSVVEAEQMLFRFLNPLDFGWAALTTPMVWVVARLRLRSRRP
jgi:hypothetical protein